MNRRLMALAAGALLLALLPVAALAGSGDRNRDRIPDRWERAHKLSLKVNQSSKDQDRDGLKNLAEWRNHADPRDADTDNDGLDDGDEVKSDLEPDDRDSDDDGKHDDDENAGTVQSFAAGKLTIALAGGDTLSAAVVDGVTEIDCEDDDKPTMAKASSSGDDDGDDEGEHGHHGHGGDDDDEDGDDGSSTCSTASLTVGAIVHEAEVKTIGGKAVFSQIEIKSAA